MLLRELLRISPEKVACTAPGFRRAPEAVRRRLQKVGETFFYGYHAALDDSGLDVLAEQLQEVTPEFCGFAYEGAAMALDVLDQLKPWGAGRIERFLRGPGRPHVYMVHVGIGWSMSRLRWRLKTRMARLDPLLCWLAVDGFGFHEGYFHWQRYANGEHRPPAFRRGFASRAFDQGLGRSLWFVEGANPERIARSIAALPPSRHADLWSGVGLACAYAGGAQAADMEVLRSLAGSFASHVAQGAVFAAAARDRAHNPAPPTELACRWLCGLSIQEAVALCEEELQLAQGGTEPAYEVWRRRIQMHFVGRQWIGPQPEAVCVR